VNTKTVLLPDGRVIPVMDSPLDALIEVRQRHVDQGIPGDPRRCALALAAHEQIGSQAIIFWKTRAMLETLDPSGNPLMMRYEVRGKDRDFIEKFDGQGEPGSLRLHSPVHVIHLRRPSPSQRLGAARTNSSPAPAGVKDGSRSPRVWAGPRGNLTLRKPQTIRTS